MRLKNRWSISENIRDLVGEKELTRDWNIDIDLVGHRIFEETKGTGV